MKYRVDYLRRKGERVWVIPLAGTTITRRSMLLPAVKRLGREQLELDYESAHRLAQDLNRNMILIGLPGKCFPVLSQSLTQAEIEAIGKLVA